MAYVVDHKEATETFKAAVVGMLLGDASIIPHSKSPTGQCYMQLKHSLKQKDYALYKAELLRQLTSVKVYEGVAATDKRTGKQYEWIRVVTKTHPLYTRLRERFYPSGHKVVDMTWSEKLDERGLALWYFDDGTWAPSQCYIYTLGFSEPENRFLAGMVWKKFQIHADVRKWHGGKWTLYIPTKSHQRLREIVAPYASLTRMIYKLPNERLP